MNLHFEPNLDYQMQAIEAVCDLFRGQGVCRTEFTVTMKAPTPVGADLFPGTQPEQMTLGMAESDLGVGNRLTLLDDELHKNLAEIQLRGGLPPSGTLVSGDFTVEMETGTGKTYVYLRTVFELNKRYSFSKFVIMEPSVAIKEGVYKTLQITGTTSRESTQGRPSTTSSTTPTSSGRCATSPPAQISRSWW